ncbi:MAG: thiamine phosphate synthase [Clostridiaceae bacterium]|nr:thiamine phosphate synthase [Clostridiaceae bacterium]
MENVFRILDANVNRVAEGLRVLEDLARFYYNDALLTEEIKEIRHGVRKSVNHMYSCFVQHRDSVGDVGLSVSQQNTLDNKNSIRELIIGNFKRVQEGIRVIEENLKILGQYDLSKTFEAYRYDCYSLEKNYLAGISKAVKRKLPDTDLYCLTGEEYSLGRSNIEVVRQMIEAGIKIIQYREKEKKALYKYEECKKIREMTRDAGVTFIVNDDIDIAILVDADGVHIGQEDIPIEEVRKLVGEEMIIGVSTHSPEQAQDAVARGADYIGVGPIYKTYTKKDVGEPVGLEYLEYVAKNVSIPFVAIGGIKEHNVAEVVKHGARCVAMVTEIVGAKDIAKKIEDIRKAMRAAREE